MIFKIPTMRPKNNLAVCWWSGCWNGCWSCTLSCWLKTKNNSKDNSSQYHYNQQWYNSKNMYWKKNFTDKKIIIFNLHIYFLWEILATILYRISFSWKSNLLLVVYTVDQISRFLNLARCEIHLVKSREIARSREIESQA